MGGHAGRHGPVLSGVLDEITYGASDTPSPWYEFLTEPSGKAVSLKTSVDDEASRDELSDYDISILKDIFESFGHWDRWKLVEYTHRLPEWKDPSGSSFPIDPAFILRTAGVSDEEIKELVGAAEDVWFVTGL